MHVIVVYSVCGNTQRLFQPASDTLISSNEPRGRGSHRELAVPGLGNASSTWLATAATVKVYVGGQQPGMAVKAPSNVLSAEIEVAGKEVPLSAC